MGSMCSGGSKQVSPEPAAPKFPEPQQPQYPGAAPAESETLGETKNASRDVSGVTPEKVKGSPKRADDVSGNAADDDEDGFVTVLVNGRKMSVPAAQAQQVAEAAAAAKTKAKTATAPEKREEASRALDAGINRLSRNAPAAHKEDTGTAEEEEAAAQPRTPDRQKKEGEPLARPVSGRYRQNIKAASALADFEDAGALGSSPNPLVAPSADEGEDLQEKNSAFKAKKSKKAKKGKKSKSDDDDEVHFNFTFPLQSADAALNEELADALDDEADDGGDGGRHLLGRKSVDSQRHRKKSIDFHVKDKRQSALPDIAAGAGDTDSDDEAQRKPPAKTTLGDLVNRMAEEGGGGNRIDPATYRRGTFPVAVTEVGKKAAAPPTYDADLGDPNAIRKNKDGTEETEEERRRRRREENQRRRQSDGAALLTKKERDDEPQRATGAHKKHHSVIPEDAANHADAPLRPTAQTLFS